MNRSGRTGRAGRKGICVTLFPPRGRATLQFIERSTKNAFEWSGAPQPQAIMLTAAATAAEDAAAVEAGVAGLFAPAAADLLAACGGDAGLALQRLLAVATGYTEAPPVRSLLSSSEGYVTVQFDGKGATISALGFVWGALRRHLPDGYTEGNAGVRGMQLTEGDKGAVFDVKVSEEKGGLSLEALRSLVERADCLALCETLPPLKMAVGKGGGKGGKGGGKGKGSGGKGGGKGKSGKGSPFGGRGGRGGGKGGRG